MQVRVGVGNSVLLLVEQDAEREMEGLETDFCQLVRQLGDFGLMFHGGVWVRLGCGRLGGILAACSVHLEQRLSFIVVGSEVAVLEWPCW